MSLEETIREHRIVQIEENVRRLAPGIFNAFISNATFNPGSTPDTKIVAAMLKCAELLAVALYNYEYVEEK